LFTSILEKESGFDVSSFDHMPVLFNGIQTSMFGMSSSLQENPFFKIKEIAMCKTNSWEDRTQSVRYMQKIPHIKRDENCIEAALSIVSDEQYSFTDRYFFFSNNEKLIKLNYEIVNACHRYVYTHFETLNNGYAPLVYKILSAQYILTQFPLGTFDIDGVQQFLLSVAKDKDVQINYRAECADILDRTGYDSYKKYGREIINELGSLYTQNKSKTIYTNLQNVHDETITEKIIDTLRYLMSTIVVPPERNTGEIYERIVCLSENDNRKDRIVASFQRILIDTAKYEGLCVSDILLLVWEKICSSSNKSELETRLLDELYEMNDTCSSGHLTRIMNILSGFFDDIQPVKISYREQLRTNVFARYTAVIRTLSQDIQDQIIQEMTSETKDVVNEVIFSLSPEDELRDEFVPRYLSKEDFNEVYEKSEKDFFGFI
jgi:hypothetical protein